MPYFAFNLPVPHVYADGSVTKVAVRKFEGHSHAHVVDEGGAMIIIGSADHARAIARALEIAADNWDKGEAP